MVLLGRVGMAEVAGAAAFPSAWLVGSRGVQLGLQGKDETLEAGSSRSRLSHDLPLVWTMELQESLLSCCLVFCFFNWLIAWFLTRPVCCIFSVCLLCLLPRGTEEGNLVLFI